MKELGKTYEVEISLGGPMHAWMMGIERDQEYEWVLPTVSAKDPPKRGRQCSLCGKKEEYGMGTADALCLGYGKYVRFSCPLGLTAGIRE